MTYKVPFVDPRDHYRKLKPQIDGAIVDCLSQGDLILRQQLRSFEHNLASFVGVRYAIGVNSGYHALHFSLLAAGYFLTTLGLRFVFPALSVEGRAVWILLASPVRLARLLGGKLALYSAAGFAGLGGIALAGGVRLGLPPTGLVLYAETGGPS